MLLLKEEGLAPSLFIAHWLLHHREVVTCSDCIDMDYLIVWVRAKLRRIGFLQWGLGQAGVPM